VNVATYLLRGKEPSKKALLLSEGEFSYGEISQAVENGARGLISGALRRGDRVLLLAENNRFWVVTYLSALRAGMVCVPLPTSLTESELQHIISVTQPARAFVQVRFAGKYAQQLAGTQVITDGDFPPGGATDVPLPDTAPDDLAALMFTSGSTGKPRGVMVSHRNIVANTESIIAALRLSADDRVMAVLPFHYCFGTSLLHTHFAVGGSVVVDRRFLFPEVVLRRMRDTECTGFAGVPSHYQILLRKSSIRKLEFPRLRYVQQAGGHLAPAFVRELRSALPDKQIFIMYGQTEATARLTTLPAEMLDCKPGSIGLPIPGVILRLLDAQGNPVPPGEVGEIVAAGDNITQGYWLDPEETKATFRDGRLHTGDFATQDQDGYFYIVDRGKDFLKCGGRRVSSQQLEDILLEYEGVLEAAVIGIPDDILGEAVKAFIVPRAERTPDLEACVLAFCNQHMAPAFRPKQVIVVSSLPKNSSGKVIKSLLRSQ
jgi:acyl-CoA synthetase (AMP-forming)/AMP-acid ligase II